MPRMIDNLAPDVRDDLAELAMKLAANKDTRKTFLGAVKKVDPQRRFPSQEVDDLREELQAAREQEKEEARLTREREQIENRLAEQRRALNGRGYSEEQIKEVEGVMTKYGITDYEAGADLWQARRPPENPAGPTATWEMPTIGNTPLADLIADPTKAARNEAFNVITEIRRGRAA